MNYAVSDIHGKCELFKRLLSEINFGNDDKLYILGDVIDRGEDPVGVLDIIMQNENITLLKGNHEGFLIEFLDKYWNEEKNEYVFDENIYNLMKLLHEQKLPIIDGHYDFMNLSHNKLRAIHTFLKELPLHLTLDDFILCHAGLLIPYDNIPVQEINESQDDDTWIWIREDFYENPNRVQDKTIVFGHTPTVYIEYNHPAVIWKNKLKDKIGIDCGAFFTGTLACLRLDDMKEFYITESKSQI